MRGIQSTLATIENYLWEELLAQAVLTKKLELERLGNLSIVT